MLRTLTWAGSDTGDASVLVTSPYCEGYETRDSIGSKNVAQGDSEIFIAVLQLAVGKSDALRVAVILERWPQAIYPVPLTRAVQSGSIEILRSFLRAWRCDTYSLLLNGGMVCTQATNNAPIVGFLLSGGAELGDLDT